MRSFSLTRDYSYNCQMWVKFQETIKFRRRLLTSSIKGIKIKQFHVEVEQKQQSGRRSVMHHKYNRLFLMLLALPSRRRILNSLLLQAVDPQCSSGSVAYLWQHSLLVVYLIVTNAVFKHAQLLVLFESVKSVPWNWMFYISVLALIFDCYILLQLKWFRLNPQLNLAV